VLFENDSVRVLAVAIAAGDREPEHTHREPSVMIVDGPARIHYYQGDTLTFSSPEEEVAETQASWMDPEGPHSVENVDKRPYHAIWRRNLSGLGSRTRHSKTCPRARRSTWSQVRDGRSTLLYRHRLDAGGAGAAAEGKLRFEPVGGLDSGVRPRPPAGLRYRTAAPRRPVPL